MGKKRTRVEAYFPAAEANTLESGIFSRWYCQKEKKKRANPAETKSDCILFRES